MICEKNQFLVGWYLWNQAHRNQARNPTVQRFGLWTLKSLAMVFAVILFFPQSSQSKSFLMACLSRKCWKFQIFPGPQDNFAAGTSCAYSLAKTCLKIYEAVFEILIGQTTMIFNKVMDLPIARPKIVSASSYVRGQRTSRKLDTTWRKPVLTEHHILCALVARGPTSIMCTTG